MDNPVLRSDIMRTVLKKNVGVTKNHNSDFLTEQKLVGEFSLCKCTYFFGNLTCFPVRELVGIKACINVFKRSNPIMIPVAGY